MGYEKLDVKNIPESLVAPEFIGEQVSSRSISIDDACALFKDEYQKIEMLVKVAELTVDFDINDYERLSDFACYDRGTFISRLYEEQIIDNNFVDKLISMGHIDNTYGEIEGYDENNSTTAPTLDADGEVLNYKYKSKTIDDEEYEDADRDTDISLGAKLISGDEIELDTVDEPDPVDFDYEDYDYGSYDL
jgi:hypothetical protein